MRKVEETTKLPPGPTRTIIPAQEAQAWRDGYGFLDAARRETKAILSSAQREYKREMRRGYSDGREAGAAEATRIIATTTAQVDAYLAKAEGELVDLAMTIVEQVLGSMDIRDVVGHAAANALQTFRNEKMVHVTVHPDCEERVRDLIAAIDNSDYSLPPIAVDVDPEMALDGCLVSSPISSIDASITTQLAAIRKAFEETRA